MLKSSCKKGSVLEILGLYLTKLKVGTSDINCITSVCVVYKTCIESLCGKVQLNLNLGYLGPWNVLTLNERRQNWGTAFK